MGSLYSNQLKVRRLEPVLLRRAKFPLAGMPVANVLRVVCSFSAYLTDSSHDVSFSA